MFRIKICGVRLKQDIEAVSEAGGDAIGLNFYPPSVRFVDPQSTDAQELAESARQCRLFSVGVFVNEDPETVVSVARRLGLNAVQLHGDETVSDAQKAKQLLAKAGGDQGVGVVRAIKLPRTPLDVEQIDELCRPFSDLGCHLLLDADAGSAHGGSGKCLDWPSVANWAETRPEISWSLAGGLKPENVADAIDQSSARSVDTASGVECPKGVKNIARIRGFVESAKAAF